MGEVKRDRLLIAIVCGRKLYKDANDRLDRAVKALEDDEADDEA